MKIYGIAFAFMVLAVVSCKKEDSEEVTTYKQFSGSLNVQTLPKYVNPGMTFDIDASGVSIPQDEEDKTLSLKYIFSFSLAGKPDTLDTPHYRLEIPDTLADFTFKCTVTASGYSAATSSSSSSIVSGRSLAYDTPSGEKQIGDGGETIYAVENDGLLWMSRNYFANGTAYYREPAILEIFGGFYSWNEAVSACPEGWSIPTVEQWDALSTVSGDLMCNASFNGKTMWEFWPAVNITNSTGISAIPAGYAEKRDDLYNFAGLNEYAVFWASDGGEPACRYIYVSDPQTKTFIEIDKDNFLASLRCVKAE